MGGTAFAAADIGAPICSPWSKLCNKLFGVNPVGAVVGDADGADGIPGMLSAETGGAAFVAGIDGLTGLAGGEAGTAGAVLGGFGLALSPKFVEGFWFAGMGAAGGFRLAVSPKVAGEFWFTGAGPAAGNPGLEFCPKFALAISSGESAGPSGLSSG
ncbi:hypothetical protein JMUB5695_04408 [Mycobacterium heckeshornense]|nr:hypothetical protein JMUB5695_04408 [Mycobacterium heckeshornense]